MSKLPPLTNLPSWSRSSLERRKVQRSITKDPVVSSSRNQTENPPAIRRDSGLKLSHSAKTATNRIVSAPSSPQEKARSRRETQLQNNLTFLQEQHQETLTKLHEEIEKLKSENKELNFKLIVTSENSTPSSASGSKSRASGSYYRSKIRRLENDIKNIKLSLIEAQKQNLDLSKRLNERELSGKRYKTLPPVSSLTNAKLKGSESTQQDVKAASTSNSGPNLASRESIDQNINHLNLFSPGKTTVLQVTFGKKGEIYVQPPTGTQSRSPTMSECKDIIHYLEDTNKRQGQELIKLREEKKEGNYTTKFSPDTYLVTKTLNGRAHYDQNSVILPALRPAGSGNVAERRRGQQAVLRGRGKRDMNC
ncbi:uncharacterized protein LOC114520418 [Dendronephthya gigantea]|uniref:uncharacterized protein LOC114520418 n=1 Tax=Dendronephthya gigantea TaxID=151771 RepID=UPI00106C25C5|nr:uncharacterized protein LOC114520418 [Dendronephthya gigantea]